MQDNFSGHVVPDNLTRICIENFRPNLTVHVQPNDQGIICCFKAHYRAKFIHRAIDLYEAGITPSKIYNIDQLEAMQLAEATWNEVDVTMIRNCWHKAGILPTSNLPSPIQPPSIPISSLIHTTKAPNNPVMQAEELLHTALDDLESTGILQCLNRMDLVELLNPAAKAHSMVGATDDEIYQSVMDAKKVREGDEDDLGNESMPIEPAPTRNEALQVALVLRKYVEELDDPFARKLEMMLDSFGWRMRVPNTMNMKDSKLTSYFVCK